MGAFLGFVQQENSINLDVLLKNSSNTPVNADSLPSYRVYGPSGLVADGGMSLKDSASITGASNANPIVVTSANHGLSTGTVVTISGVLGNTNANGTFVSTRLDANTFSIAATGNGSYTSGGTWNTTGLYTAALTVAGSSGFAAGNTYTVLVSAQVSSAAWADVSTFCVT